MIRCATSAVAIAGFVVAPDQQPAGVDGGEGIERIGRELEIEVIERAAVLIVRLAR